MSLAAPTTAYVCAVVFLATLIRSTLGFGEALVAVPLLALRLPVAVAAPLAVLVSLLVAGVIVAQDWRSVELRSAGGLILSALAGIPLGLLLLAKGDDRMVKSLLGGVIVAFSLYSLAGRARPHLERDHWGWLLGCGFVSGVLGGAYGMNGPPLVVYGSLRRWSPQHFRATLQGYFLAASLAGLLGYVALGFWRPETTRCFLVSLPAIAAAVWLGRALNRRMRGDGFFRVVYAGLLVTGGVLIAQAAAA
ncbi:MAG TPA: sulfite exporter TauE/SafE family protein [Opitutaceae bacterium]|nr:sulfite exporter TauE/SafE family protein [Opitutaceae bacterium]